MEPFFILLENRHAGVRRYFDRAIREIERKNLGLALFNLNIVLDLKPNHFLARVYRGRIHLWEKRYPLAVEDFIQANTISAFRFGHYDLYSEYLESVHQDDRAPLALPGLGIAHGGWAQAPDLSARQLGYMEGLAGQESLSGMEPDWEDDLVESCCGPDLTGDEVEKFRDLGPITLLEMEDTDWDQVLRKLLS